MTNVLTIPVSLLSPPHSFISVLNRRDFNSIRELFCASLSPSSLRFFDSWGDNLARDDCESDPRDKAVEIFFKIAIVFSRQC